MFTGNTKNLGIMGWPVEHSLSPAMQNAALAAKGLDYSYIPLPVKPEHLEIAVKGLWAAGFCGWNVTIPHKSAIMPLLSSVDKDAQILGAVNTVAVSEGNLAGYNTDVAGFLRGLQSAGFDPRGQRTAVLGAGGAARAVVWGLCKSGAKSIFVAARNREKSRSLAEKLETYGNVTGADWKDPAFSAVLPETDLLVNTTPLGMFPHLEDAPPVDLGLLRKGALVYDVIYTPSKTMFLGKAEALGHPIVNGESMLVGQGAESFRIWTGGEPDTELMQRILRNSLSARENKGGI